MFYSARETALDLPFEPHELRAPPHLIRDVGKVFSQSPGRDSALSAGLENSAHDIRGAAARMKLI